MVNKWLTGPEFSHFCLKRPQNAVIRDNTGLQLD
jgi:hypothetical protein